MPFDKETQKWIDSMTYMSHFQHWPYCCEPQMLHLFSWTSLDKFTIPALFPAYSVELGDGVLPFKWVSC